LFCENGAEYPVVLIVSSGEFMVALRRLCTSLLFHRGLSFCYNLPAPLNRLNSGTSRAMAAQEASEAPVEVQCFCGKVALAVTGPPSLGRSYCHCSICRRLSGSPFSANGLWPASAVRPIRGWEEASGEAVQVLATSKHVSRVRCGSCGGPLKADLMGGKAVSSQF